MHPLPIVVRELSVGARRPATYWTRSGAALGAMLVVGFMIVTSHAAPNRLGHDMFVFQGGLVFAWALLAGVRCTADTLSEEKREGTLGFLFLTDLHGYDVVIGKLVGRSLEAIYTIVAVAPVLAIPILLGAVTGSEFWRMNLLLLNALIFSLCLGLVVSTFGRSERVVALTTLFTTVGFAGLPLVWLALRRFTSSRWLDVFLLWPSPSYAFHTVTDAIFRRASHEYYLAMSTIAGLSLAALILSSIALPHLFQERISGPSRWSRSIHRWRFGRLGRSWKRRLLLESEPFLWLLTRDKLPRRLLLLFSLFVVGFAVWVPGALSPPGKPTTPIAVIGAFVLHQTFKALVAAEAARRFNADKRSGALGLLLTSPVSVRSLIRAQERRLQGLFFLPFLSLALLNYALYRAQQSFPSPAHEESVVILGGVAIAACDFIAISRMAMLSGLRQTRFVKAWLGGFAAVMAFPWGIVLVFMFTTASGPTRPETVTTFFSCWLIFCALYDFGLANWAKTELRDKFRALAADDVPHESFLAPAPHLPLDPSFSPVARSE